MRWRLPWRRDQAQRADDALRATEELAAAALAQRQRVQALTPRVEAAYRTQLRRLRVENGQGAISMIENVVPRPGR